MKVEKKKGGGGLYHIEN